MGDIQGLQGRLGYAFDEPELLRRALVHPSAINERLAKAEDARHELRFSWLGDAVLHMMVTDKLYSLFPNASPDELTKWRQKLTNNATLGRAARAIELEKAITSGRALRSFLASGKDSKALADVFESIIGAVYIDGGLRPAGALVRRLLDAEFRALLERVEEGVP